MKNIYCLLDVPAAFCRPPFVLNTDNEAKRAMRDAVEAGAFNGHDEDFVLLKIGEWDDVSGEIKPDSLRPVVARGIDAKFEVERLKIEAEARKIALQNEIKEEVNND